MRQRDEETGRDARFILSSTLFDSGSENHFIKRRSLSSAPASKKAQPADCSALSSPSNISTFDPAFVNLAQLTSPCPSPSGPTADQLQVVLARFQVQGRSRGELEGGRVIQTNSLAIHSVGNASNSQTDSASSFDRRAYYGQRMLRPYRSGISTVSRNVTEYST